MTYFCFVMVFETRCPKICVHSETQHRLTSNGEPTCQDSNEGFEKVGYTDSTCVLVHYSANSSILIERQVCLCVQKRGGSSLFIVQGLDSTMENCILLGELGRWPLGSVVPLMLSVGLCVAVLSSWRTVPCGRSSTNILVVVHEVPQVSRVE